MLLADSGPDANLTTPATERHPLSAFEKAVAAVAERVNYGIDDAPAALCEWRWEVKDMSVFPDDVREKLQTRRADRVKVRAVAFCTSLLLILLPLEGQSHSARAVRRVTRG